MRFSHFKYGPPAWFTTRANAIRQADLRGFYGVAAPPGFTHSLPVCDAPESSPLDPNVCGRCGHPITEHQSPVIPKEYLPYREALWRWLLKHGGIENYYGGYHGVASMVIAEHVLECGIADNVTIPTSVELDEFNGTDNGGDTVDSLTGDLSCRCGEVVNLPWSLKTPASLGEVIFEVIREGELPHE